MRTLILCLALVSCAVDAPGTGYVTSDEACSPECTPGGGDGGDFIVIADECTRDRASYELDGESYESRWDRCGALSGGGRSCSLSVAVGGGHTWVIECVWGLDWIADSCNAVLF